MDSKNDKVSIRGKIASNSLRFFMHLPIKTDLGFKISLLAEKNKMRWKVPKGYKLTKFNIQDIPIEMLECDNGKKNKAILQFHGGGYYLKFNNLYRRLALKYCNITEGANVFSVDYKTAPDYKYPAALEDALVSWNWLLENGFLEENIIVVGDSAGGNLALALTMRLRDEKRKLPKALVLMSPWTDLARKGKSYEYNIYNDPLFGLKKGQKGIPLSDKEFLWLYPGETDLENRYLSPAYGKFDGFPPMLIQVGANEVIESDSMTVYEKAKAASIDVKLTTYNGMFHVFQLMGNILPEAKQAWEEVEQFIKVHLD